MKILFAALVTLFVSNSYALVLKSVDHKNGCDLYRVTKTEESSEIRSNEVVFMKKPVYGIKIEDMDIDFRNEEVTVTPIAQVVLGFDKPLIGRVTISGSNKNFKALTNQLNKSLTVFENVCISSDNRLIHAKVRVTESSK
jgi:hypothetical protein